jgi:hypothetical protein
MNTTNTEAVSTEQLYYHAQFKGNPYNGGVINVTRDVPQLPIRIREQK